MDPMAIDDYVDLIRSADWLLILFYLFLFSVALYSVYLAINVFRMRITWGQARRMGIPAAIFVWIQGIFYLAVADGAYGVVSIILGTPLWLDLTIAFASIIAVVIVFFLLTRRPTFKPRLFIALVLVPLGVPGTHMFAKLVRVGAIEVAPVGAVLVLKQGDEAAAFLAEHADDMAASIPFLRRIPKVSETIIGPIAFATTATKGTLGDAITARRLTGMGYQKVPSKYDIVHGIDAIYAKWKAPGVPGEILIVENKVDGGRLTSGQMSDEWVRDRLARLLESADDKSRAAIQSVIQAIEQAPELVRKELWHHDLASGVTTVHALDAAGTPVSQIYKFEDKHIANELTRRCPAIQVSGCTLQ